MTKKLKQPWVPRDCSVALFVGCLFFLFAQPALSAFCRISDFSDRALSSLSEVERLATVTQMTRTEFSEFSDLEEGDPNYYRLLANSQSLFQARKRAESALDKADIENFRDYLVFWATNQLSREQLTAFNICDAEKTVGVWIYGRMHEPGVVDMVFSHIRPVGVAGPLPMTLVSTTNVANTADLREFLEKEIGQRDQFKGIEYRLKLADAGKAGSVAVKFGEERPQTLHIPPFPFPEVKLPVTAEEGFVGSAFTDCDVCPQMVGLPGGSFIMGTPEGEDEREGTPEHLWGRSSPRLEVAIEPGLAVSKFEITNAQFRAFVEDTGYQASDSCHVMSRVNGVEVYQDEPGYNWDRLEIPTSEQHPVVCITWGDARAYADWLSRKTGYEYRLLSEAEYEYAVRGGTDTAYYWGNDLKRTEACTYSNQPDRSLAKILDNNTGGFSYRFQCDDGHPYLAPVGKFQANAFGLHDMLGNAWEFVADCWNDNYVGAPADGSAWLDGNCDVRVMRGGSYGNTPWFARVSNRAQVLSDYAGSSFSFRVATER